MPVFVNYKKKYFLFTSYKVAYSTLRNQSCNDLTYIHYRITLPVLKHIIKHYKYKRYLIVRHPIKRTISLFSDKFRKQPKRILEGLHNWENCHKVIFPLLNIHLNETDANISEKISKLSLHRFILLLPKIINSDDHYFPQSDARSFYFFKKLKIKIPIHKIFRIEDESKKIQIITGINLNKKLNTSESNKFLSQLNENDKIIINKLYKKDFKLSNYKIDDLI